MRIVANVAILIEAYKSLIDGILYRRVLQHMVLQMSIYLGKSRVAAKSKKIF